MKTKSRGFTLVELILFMGLMSVLLLLMTQISTTVLQVQVESEKSSRVVQDGRFILNRLTYDVKRAKSITLPASAGSTGSTLQLIITEGGVDRTYTYVLAGSQLQLTNYLGTNALNSIGTTVSGFTVTRIGNAGGKATVSIAFTLTSVAKQNTSFEVQSFSTTLGLR